jgi:hypothetical protein
MDHRDNLDYLSRCMYSVERRQRKEHGYRGIKLLTLLNGGNVGIDVCIQYAITNYRCNAGR